MSSTINKDISASGLTYKEQENIIERVATAKAYQYKKIGYYEIDDLKQEVRIKCWSVINRYDPDCGTNLYVFLSVCADNKLRDIKRGVMYKHNKPCIRCPFWDSAAASSGKHDCLVYGYKMDCERYSKHERYVQAKLSASNPIDIDSETIQDNNSYTSHQEQIELIDYIESKLPVGLLDSFRKLKSNNYDHRCLKPRERNILMNSLKDLLGDFNIGD